MDIRALLNQSSFSQVGFVVHDIEETKRRFALLFGGEVPTTGDGGQYEITRTTVFGQPAPDAEAKLAFFDLVPGVQLELIEPNHASSVWRDWLDKYGEGIHHIAFNVRNADEVAAQLVRDFGGTIEQQGKYGDGSGQYIYVSCQEKLKCRIELLESFHD